MTGDRYPLEQLDPNEDDGRMPENVQELAEYESSLRDYFEGLARDAG